MSDFKTVVGNWTLTVSHVGKFELLVTGSNGFGVLTTRVFLDDNERAIGFKGDRPVFPVVAEIALEKLGIDVSVIKDPVVF
jgi:hypothetical protein